VDAGRAVANLEIQELPEVWPGADETSRLGGILRHTLCREIRHWLLQAGVWRGNVELKSLAYARSIAGAADEWTYAIAVQNALRGYSREPRFSGMSEAERAAHEAEEHYQLGRRR
jgi:hypothetical protein